MARPPPGDAARHARQTARRRRGAPLILARKTPKPKGPTPVETIRHKDARVNIPTEELRDFMADDEKAPKHVLYPRDPSLGPQHEKLKRALRADIDESAWSTLYSTISRPFAPPESGKIAVKVINHYGDDVLKVYDVDAAPDVKGPAEAGHYVRR